MADEQVAVVGQTKGVSVIGYSIVASVADDRQITFQHFIPHDADDAEVHSDLDRIMGVIDRQKAIYELPKLVEERQSLADQVSQGEEDVKTVELNHQKALSGVELQLTALRAEQKKLTEAAYNQHIVSGRRGEFQPKGGTKAQLDRLADDIEKLLGESVRATTEADIHRQSFEASQHRRRERIALLDEKIAERRLLAPGGG